jgi:ribosomal protein S18 acetylase RimI-like enzyme
MKISYRKLESADAGLYRAIRLESLKLHPDSFGSSYEEQRKLPKLMFEKALESPVDARFVMGAYDQGELIGICGFVPLVADDYQALRPAGTLIQMYVKPAYRGRKIGLGLVKALMHEAFSLPNIEQVVLEVKEGNMGAIRVYEQAGFLTYQADGRPAGVNKAGTRTMIIRRGD